MSAAASSAKLEASVEKWIARNIFLEKLGEIEIKEIGLSVSEQTHDEGFKEIGLVFQGGYLLSYDRELLISYQGSCHSECSLGESKNSRIHVAPRNLPCFITPVGATWNRG